MLQYVVFVGVAIQLIGIIPYLKETLRGTNQPNKITWFFWSLAPMIGVAAALTKGVTWAVLPTFMAGFVPLLVFLASFTNKKAYWKLEKFDYLCGLFSLLALILWGLTKEPSVAILFAVLSDGSAALPTIIKMWKHPETEGVSPFISGAISNSTSFFAIRTWNFPSLAFPIYLVLVNLTLIVAYYHGRSLKQNSAELAG